MWSSSSSSLRAHDHATTALPFSFSLLSSLAVNRRRSPSSFAAVAVLFPSLSPAVPGFLKPITFHLFSPRSPSSCIHVALSLSLSDLYSSAWFHPPLLASISLCPPMMLSVFVPSPFSYSLSALVSPCRHRAPALTSLISPFSIGFSNRESQLRKSDLLLPRLRLLSEPSWPLATSRSQSPTPDQHPRRLSSISVRTCLLSIR